MNCSITKYRKSPDHLTPHNQLFEYRTNDCIFISLLYSDHWWKLDSRSNITEFVIGIVTSPFIFIFNQNAEGINLLLLL